MKRMSGLQALSEMNLTMPTLADVYEDHAEDCIRAAARVADPKRRDVLLDLAVKWREDAQALRRAGLAIRVNQ
jgi:hypothetical protein